MNSIIKKMNSIIKKGLSILIISILAISIKAQPYKLFIPNIDYLYADTANYFKGFRIIKTEVDINGDSVYYPIIETTVIETGDNIYKTKQFSWISQKIICKKSGKTILFNFNNDSLIFNTKASVNDSWEFYHFKNGSKILAKVSAFDTQSVLGNIDSVKTISFEYYDSANQKQPYKLDSFNLKLSKFYGLTRTLNFVSFPDINVTDVNHNRTEILATYDISGLNNLKTKSLTKEEVYDFDPGDQMDIYDYVNTGYPAYGCYIKTIKTKRTVLDKNVTGNVINYKMHDIAETNTKGRLTKDTITISHSDTTVWVSYNLIDTLFNSLPGLDLKQEKGSFLYIFQPKMTISNFNKRDKMIQNENYIPFTESNDTLHPGFVDGCAFYDHYYEGLGGPYYSGGCIDGPKNHILVYYKKGTETWGTPLSISPDNNRSNEPIINIYPNPCHSTAQIKIHSTTDGSLFFFDHLGRQVYSAPFRSGDDVITLNFSYFKPGMYCMQLVPKKGTPVSRKFVVE